ncbi:hypothetical protein, variant [Aphanomyces invadans]|uniref:C3H1-type domain-containing protein n=1 Tax=Aphanomyces invadans TaxID=157072 RepID=A0A024TX77_9STRA|nr:hypothetical protein H310_09235 [Aphanomyces invadans]XP_008873479.1 hypothetical protein, variant [Aphanomyces invadans]ETV97917.1 hypothetical protein H310_09235 [Aphanomyces invadans]ETV97918.1 hypothetical protein, variant [Aphanomyces invadans]|eukprot:XP_008873478.1 hypothetical protein H310_09235 [Aphanomyces invadans]
MEASGSVPPPASTHVSLDKATTDAGTGNPDSVAKNAVSEKPVGKKRRRERRLALKKTQLCRHFDKPDGCPFPDCVYAHGLDELQDGGTFTVTAQRKLIRDQGEKRQADKFVHKDDATVVDYVSRTGSMVDRYYTRMYAADIMGEPSEDQFINMHSNRLCVIGIAPGHAIFTRGLTVIAIDFEPTIVESKVSGKKKKGGVWLNPDTVLCRIKCSTGDVFAFRSCIRGALIEINESLTPALFTTKPFTQGFLAIVRPKPVEIVEIQASLLPQQDYLELRASHVTAASFR